MSLAFTEQENIFAFGFSFKCNKQIANFSSNRQGFDFISSTSVLFSTQTIKKNKKLKAIRSKFRK